MSNEIQSISQSNYILHNIDAKKLYVQEPLFTANSGDAVYVGWRPDETVLYSGSYTHGTFPAITASGSIWDYDKVEITICPAAGGVRHPVTETWYTDDLALNKYIGFTAATFNGTNLNVTYPHTVYYSISDDGTIFNPYYAGYYNVTMSGTSPGANKTVTLSNGRFNTASNSTYELGITRVIGINRKENA